MAFDVSRDLLEKAVVSFQRGMASVEREGRRPLRGRVVAISRMPGAGGAEVARRVGERLGWPVWDRQILDLMAENSKYRRQMFESLDERTQSWIESFLESFVEGGARDVYTHLLPRVMCIISSQDAVILGRGAHLVLDETLSVFLKAPYRDRLDTLMHKNGIDEARAKKELARLDEEHEAFLARMAKRFRRREYLNPPEGFDLVVNTRSLGYDHTADLIVQAARWLPVSVGHCREDLL